MTASPNRARRWRRRRGGRSPWTGSRSSGRYAGTRRGAWSRPRPAGNWVAARRTRRGARSTCRRPSRGPAGWPTGCVGDSTMSALAAAGATSAPTPAVSALQRLNDCMLDNRGPPEAGEEKAGPAQRPGPRWRGADRQPQRAAGGRFRHRGSSRAGGDLIGVGSPSNLTGRRRQSRRTSGQSAYPLRANTA